MPIGRLSVFPGLGMRTLLAGLKLNLPDFRSSATLVNQVPFSPSSVVEVIPLDMLPGFPLIAS